MGTHKPRGPNSCIKVLIVPSPVCDPACRFLVKPSETKDFVEAFLKVRDEVTEEKGNLIYSLSKPLTDNVSFYAYAGAQGFGRHPNIAFPMTELCSCVIRPVPSCCER